MDMVHFSYFSALYETLNYTEAAKKCYISRQAMRQSLRMLEQTYGVCLIENQHNHLRATAAGTVLYEKSQFLVQAFNELNTSMHSCIRADQPLRVGISRSIVPYYAPEVLQAVREFPLSYPRIPVEISLLSANEILQRLEEQSLDAGILVDMGAYPFPFRRTVLRTDTLMIALSVTHPFSARKKLSFSDLDGQTVMLMSDPEPCFLPLAKKAREKNLEVNWLVVPDYFEASYKSLQGTILSIDRSDSVIQGTRESGSDSDIEIDLLLSLPFENNQYLLNCCLLTPLDESTPVRIFREALENT